MEYTPFDKTFNEAVLAMAHSTVGFYYASDTDSTSDMMQINSIMEARQPYPVADHGSDCTIFGDPKVNHAFRAWHDWCHWKGGFDFSLNGEFFTYCLHREQIFFHYGLNDKTLVWVYLLEAEIFGQRQYFEKFDEYVKDQRSFAVAYLKDKQSALLHKF